MKKTVLFLTAVLLAAGSATAAPRRATATGPVHADWHAAVMASRLDTQQPIVLTPVSWRRGVAVYRLAGSDGRTELARVAFPFDPTRPAADGPAQVTAAACVPGSPRCDAPSGFFSPDSSRCTVNLYRDINYQGPNTATNLDWNTFSDVPGGVNDSASSIRTTCAPVYFFKDKNWLSSSLYVPANTSVSTLVPLGFNDSITSLFHVLP
jgi:hypothetical protein